MLLALTPATARAQTTNLHTFPPRDAPDISYVDAQGQPHKLSDEKNKLTIVHFWATWCIPCIMELPEVDATQRAYTDKGLKVIAVSMDGPKNLQKVQKFYADHHITALPAYFDPGMAASRGLGLRGVPTTFFFNRNGKEIGMAEKPLDWKDEGTTGFIEFGLKPGK